MDDEMVKVYEEAVFNNDSDDRIWLNDILDDENIVYKIKIVNREDALFTLNFTIHKVIEIYVPKFYAEKVLKIIDEYNESSVQEEIINIPELADYSHEPPLPDDIQSLLNEYNSSKSKDDSLKNGIIDKCVKINLKEYNCQFGSLDRIKFEDSLVAKKFQSKYNQYSGDGYTANYSINDNACEVYTIALYKVDDKNDDSIFAGTYIHFCLNESYNETFCYEDEIFNTYLSKEFVNEVSELLKSYDHVITFSLRENILDILISDYYIVDMDYIDTESLSKKAMVFKFNVLKNIILKIKELIEEYLY